MGLIQTPMETGSDLVEVLHDFAGDAAYYEKIARQMDKPHQLAEYQQKTLALVEIIQRLLSYGVISHRAHRRILEAAGTIPPPKHRRPNA